MIIGITGSFGTGKSTVARMFRDLGALVLDADKIAHKLIRPGTPSYSLIVSCFGKGVICEDRRISRPKLGKMVFGNKKLLKKLNDILHPVVIKEIKARAGSARSRPIVIDAPLLIEAQLTGLVDTLIVVKTSRNTQISRSGMGSSEALKRIKAQLPLSEKIKMADFVIDNEGSLLQTKRQVKDIWKQICRIANS